MHTAFCKTCKAFNGEIIHPPSPPPPPIFWLNLIQFVLNFVAGYCLIWQLWKALSIRFWSHRSYISSKAIHSFNINYYLEENLMQFPEMRNMILPMFSSQYCSLGNTPKSFLGPSNLLYACLVDEKMWEKDLIMASPLMPVLFFFFFPSFSGNPNWELILHWLKLDHNWMNPLCFTWVNFYFRKRWNNSDSKFRSFNANGPQSVCLLGPFHILGYTYNLKMETFFCLVIRIEGPIWTKERVHALNLN